MKKVLSFCVLSVLLAVLSVGLKAQSGLVLNPANMPEVVLNQYDTIYLSPNSSCFDALGLADNDQISIEWQVLYNGSVIPNDSLSYYFEDFKFESRFDMGLNTNQWWGNSYTSGYCQYGDGVGSYPGANTPTAYLHLGQPCEIKGHFGLTPAGQNNPEYFDFFYVRWFKDAANTGHRLVYNIKVDGDYQFIFSLARRCNGTKLDHHTVYGTETYYVGGHQSQVCGILSSDTLHTAEVSDITDYFRCVGDTLYIGNPVVAFTESTDTATHPYDSVFYMGISSCNGSIDSIVRFRVFFEDPSVPVLDTAGSVLAVCDSGEISIKVNLTAADKCIWLDEARTVIDTLDATAAFTDTINANTHYYVLGFNSVSGCVSSDSLTVYVEVFASPNPVVSATKDTLCENGVLHITLDQEYDKWTWFHDGTNMNLDTIVYDVADVQVADSGYYWANVIQHHTHSIYTTADTVSCSAADSAHITVFPRPSAHWVSFDGGAVTDSVTFCPNDLTHVIVAALTEGQAPYSTPTRLKIAGVRGEGTFSYNRESGTLMRDTITINVTVPAVCDTAYFMGFHSSVDAHGCRLKDTLSFHFFVNDTIAPTIAKKKDTISAPAYASCEYILPNVLGIIDTTDDCGIDTVYQFPEAGQHVTTDTIVIVTVTDLCGNTSTDTINVTLPFEAVAIDTIEVTQAVQCAGNADGAIRVTVENGLPPYDVRIQSIMVSDSIKTAHGTATQTVFDFAGLIEGKWAVTVTDTNGCVADLDTIDVASPNVLTLSDSILTNLTCFESNDGSFKLTVKQGTAPYEVKIVRTLDAVKDSVEMTLNCASLDTTVTMTAQKAGAYVISVVDGNGCTASVNDTITQPEQLRLLGDTVMAHVLCYGDSIGNLAVTGVTGGTYPYHYAWLNAANDTVSKDSVTGAILPAGIYTIYVVDANGCEADTTLTDTIKQPHGKLALTSSEWTDLKCFESNDGSFKYNVTEGTAPYYVTIVRTLGTDVETINDTLDPSVLDTTVLMQNMKAGAYVISVIDDNGCIADTVRDTLTQPEQLILLGDTILNHIKCYADSNGNLAVKGVTGGTMPYQYEWRDNNDSIWSTDSVTGRILAVGTYTLYVTDANNCPPSDTVSSTILGPDTALTVLSLVAPVNDTCPHLGNYMFNAEVKGGRTDYKFQWTFNTVEVRNYTTDALKDTFNYVETTVSCDTTFAIVFTVTDDSACVASKDITFTIQDTMKPVLAGTIDTMYIDACVVADLHDSLKLNTLERLTAKGFTISDNCTPYDSLVVNYNEVVTGTCPIKVVRTYSVTDKCGLTSDELTQVLFVQDTTKPVFTKHPVSDTVACNGSGNTIEFNDFVSENLTNVKAVDNCAMDTIIMAQDSVVTGCNHATKTYYYSFTAKDKCGNTTVEYATFNIIDTVKPNIVPAPDVVMECSIDNLDTIRAHSLAQFTYDDACAHNAAFVKDSLSEWTKNCGSAGYYTHYVIVTDSCQQAIASHKISIVDTKDPIFTNPPASNPVVECDGAGNLVDLYNWLYSVTAYDSCSGPIDSVRIFFVDPLDGSHLIPFDSSVVRDVDGHYASAWVSEGACNGYYRFHWEAVDSCGNVASTTEDFRIKDHKGPVFTVIRTDTIVDCDYTAAELNAWLTLPKAYDVCSRDSIEVTHTETFVPNCGNTGVYQVEWKAKDNCDSTVYLASWTIIDTIDPVITTSNAGQLLNDTIYHDRLPDYDAPIPSAWRRTGMTAAQSVDFFDNLMHGLTVTGDDSQPHFVENGAGITAVTDCGHVRDFYITNRQMIATNDCDERWTIDYVFVDDCGNDVTLTQEIIVLDTSAPIVRNIEDRMYLTDYASGCEKQPVDTFKTIRELQEYQPNDSYKASPTDLHLSTILDDPTKIELLSCVTTVDPLNTCDSVEVRTYRIWDACGNDTIFTHTITFKDTVAPVITPSVIYDTIHQMPYDQCGKYYELEAGLLSSAHYTSVSWWESNYPINFYSCHDFTISIEPDEPDETDEGVCPGKVLVRKFKVNKKCASNNYTSYFTLKLIVKDTIAPVATSDVITAGKKLHDTTIYRNDVTACDFTLPNIGFTEYKQLTEWNRGTDVYNDCNLGAESPVTNIDTLIGGDGCDSTYTFRYVVADSCGNVSTDTVTITVHILDTLAPNVTVKIATLVDTQYYNNDCTLPTLNKWQVPQDALGHGVEFSDCNPAWDVATNLVLLDSVFERDACTITYTVSYQVKDACTHAHLSDTIYQTIVILDTVAPVVTPERLDTLLTYMNDDAADCWGNVVDTFHTVADVKAYDIHFDVVDCNVGDDSKVFLLRTDSSAIMCTRMVQRYYVVKDSCDHVSNEFVHTILVRDTTAPVVTGTLTPHIVYMDDACEFTYKTYPIFDSLPTYMSVTDCNLDTLVIASIDTVKGGFSCDTSFAVYVTYNAKDSCEHKTAFVDTIYVADTLAPVVTGSIKLDTLYLPVLGCSYSAPAPYATVDDLPATIDISDCNMVKELTVSEFDTIQGFGSCPMVIRRTYTVKDSCNRTATFEQRYEVYDTVRPTVANTTLENDTVYITELGGYTVPAAFTVVAQLNDKGAGVADCNLDSTINSCKTDTIIDKKVCDGSYITRKYTVIDSCNNVSDTIVHKIVLMDTIKPVMENMPDTVWAVFVNPCTFKVPNLADTVEHHYSDNWTYPYKPAYFFKQDPVVGTELVNPRDTFVVVTFMDACGNVNTDTVRIINWADTEAPTTGLDGISYDAFVAGSCDFRIPALKDTIKNHYTDNWNSFAPYAPEGSFNDGLYEQTPASDYQVTNFADTVVTVIYGDKCGNKDTVKITIVVPDSLYISSISMETEPTCFGYNDGEIRVTVAGGTADYTYSYSGGNIVTNLTDTLFKDVAAGTYLVTVSDDHGCQDTATIVVTQPTKVNYTPVAINLENCLNGDTTEVALIMTGGTPNYHMTATLLHSDYSVVNNVFDVTNVVSASDTFKINPIADTLYVAYFGEDDHGCSISDTSDMIVVHPIYQFDTIARVCYTTAHSSGYSWVGHGKVINIPASVFTDSDSTYVFCDSMTTVHTCDSVYVLHLRVEDIPYLKVREIPATYVDDISDAVEPRDTSCFTTASTNVGWQIFVDKNCMSCSDTVYVSLEYTLYRLNESTNDYELMGDVTNYFQPLYRTFFDQFALPYTGSSSSHFSVPADYPQTGTIGHPVSYDYFNLCWLAPTYQPPMPTGYQHTESGDFYMGGRANTILISSFGSPFSSGAGDYKIVITLNKRGGSYLTPDNYYTWNLQLPVPVGGHSSQIIEPITSAEICFHVEESSSPVIHMPTTDPIGGNVIYTSRVEGPQAHIYPNPARDYVQVELTGFEGQTNVSLSNIGGKVLENINIDFEDTNTTKVIKIETGEYAQGVYMVTARNKETILTKRVVIIR